MSGQLWFNPDDVLPRQQPGTATPPASRSDVAQRGTHQRGTDGTAAAGDHGAGDDIGDAAGDHAVAATQYPQAVRDRAELDRAALRRRALLNAALHGSARTWRDRHRQWLAVAVGLALIAVAIAAVAIVHVFQQQRRADSMGGHGLRQNGTVVTVVGCFRPQREDHRAAALSETGYRAHLSDTRVRAVGRGK